MVYQNKLLVIRILFQSFQKKPLYGAHRPLAYMEETGNYSSILRFNIFKKEVKQGQQIVFETILESPVGFGEHLREGARCTLNPP